METRLMSILGRIAYVGTILTILIVAIPEGTTEPWHKGLFVVAISVLGIVRVADGFLNSDLTIAEPRLLLPLIGILVLAAVQLVPLSSGYPLSLAPYRTQLFVVVFGGLIVCTELLFNYTRSTPRLGLLVGLVLVITIGSSIFGLILHTVYGSEPTQVAGSLGTAKSYAQFANRNHFALLAEMGLGLLIGTLLKGQLRTQWRLLGWIGCGVLVYSIIVASSRGGMVSLAAMAVFAVFIHVMTRSAGKPDSRMKSVRTSLPAKILTAAFLCLLTFGTIIFLVAFIGGDDVVTRIEQIDQEIATVEQSRVNRAAIWESTWEMIKQRPVFGSGFGAYGAAITKHDSGNGRFLLEEAHNDYLEIVANGGIIGAALFAVFGILVGTRLMKTIFSSDGLRLGYCFGAIIGIVGVLIHSFVDFGLHVLVNALVLIALIVIGTSTVERSVETAEERPDRHSRRQRRQQ